MLTPKLIDQRLELEDRLVALGRHAHDGRPEQPFLDRLDHLLPSESVDTNDYARDNRKLFGPTGEEFNYDPGLTPYMLQPQKDADHPAVSLQGIKGPARSGKTIGGENICFKNWAKGPAKNVIWLMQSREDLAVYVDERVTPMLEQHDLIAEKIDWNDPKNGRNRVKVGGALAWFLAATKRALRGKSAAIIVADEIDGYPRAVANAILTYIENRQRELGSNAFAYLCSHPDMGLDGGIELVLRRCLKHLWFFRCPHCGEASTFAKEGDERQARMTWNVPSLLEASDAMDRQDLMDMIERETVLVCPHNGCAITEAERLPMSNAGVWLQRNQELKADGTVVGDRAIVRNMGYVLHGFMSPFVNLGRLARAWAEAKLDFDLTGDDTALREETVKSLGETYEGAAAEEQVEDYKTVLARLAAPYQIKTVPAGVRFLTAFADPQGDRFEIRVVGWDLNRRSWLIDAFPIKQWPGFATIDPANRLGDWDILEHAVLNQMYPLASNPERVAAGQPELFMPIARLAVNSAGQPGESTSVTNQARTWLANILARPMTGAGEIIEPYRIILFQGSAHKTGEMYPKAKPRLYDDKGTELPVAVKERVPNVHDLKRLISRRMKIDQDLPGRMRLPSNMNATYAKELTSERLVNGAWVRRGRNETWDGYVACELARETLKPDRQDIDWTDPPDWARPVERNKKIGGATNTESSYMQRIIAHNRQANGG